MTPVVMSWAVALPGETQGRFRDVAATLQPTWAQWAQWAGLR